MGLVVALLHWDLTKLGQDQASEEGSWPTGKPLVDCNDGAVNLLDLLLAKGQRGDKSNGVVLFDAHWECLLVLNC